jgi:U3 small nucleolar RNA-associated protein 12
VCLQTPADEFEHLCIIRVAAKLRSIVWSPKPRKKLGAKGRVLPILLGLANNCIAVYDVDVAAKTATKVNSVHVAGHRTDVRAVCLSSDDELLLSTSHDDIKIWNLRSHQGATDTGSRGFT